MPFKFILSFVICLRLDFVGRLFDFLLSIIIIKIHVIYFNKIGYILSDLSSSLIILLHNLNLFILFYWYSIIIIFIFVSLNVGYLTKNFDIDCLKILFIILDNYSIILDNLSICWVIKVNLKFSILFIIDFLLIICMLSIMLSTSLSILIFEIFVSNTYL
jgi:hypothetical protein